MSVNVSMHASVCNSLYTSTHACLYTCAYTFRYTSGNFAEDLKDTSTLQCVQRAGEIMYAYVLCLLYTHCTFCVCLAHG